MWFKTILKTFLVLIFVFLVSYTKAQCGTFISAFPYTEGFESGPAWTSGGTNSDWAWGTPAHPIISSAGSGSKCWTVGGLSGTFYNYSEQSWIMSPCFNFSSLNYPWISFKIFWEDEYKFDGMVLQYSLNSGTTWTNVGAFGDPVNCLNDNWYNYNNVTWLTSASPKNGWTGRSGATSGSCQGGNGSLGWVTAKHCMSSLAGQANVRFRFLFGSGTTCNSYDGISIDDILIDNAAPNVANFTYTCAGSNTVNFTNTSSMCPAGYLWDFGDGTTSASASPSHAYSSPGTYNVTLISSGPCNASGSISIPVSILGAATSVTNSTCNGANNGSASAAVFGGSGTYTYTWSPSGASTSSISGLSPGTYTVSISAAGSCPITSTAIITQPAILSASTSVSPVSCFGGSNGIASVTANGGTGAYTYSWLPSGGSSASASGLSAGTYTVIVTDANFCSATATASITAPATALAVTSVETNVSCFGGSNGTINVNATGGTSPYIYTWAPSVSSSSFLSGLSAGNYTVTVTDANGCAHSGTSLITEPTSPLNASIINTPSLCTSNNGTATVNASGGTIPYTYTWSPAGGSSSTASSLSPGIYTVSISDANGCMLSTTTTINNSGAFTTTISTTPINCFGGNDGTLSAAATGGTGPFLFLWDSGQTNSVIGSLNAGNYCVTVTDANGCQNNTCITLDNPPQMDVDFSNDPSVTDMSNPEIHFTDLSVGGIAWQWSFGDLNTSTTENPIHSYSQEGTYPVTLIVTNSFGCIDSVTHTIIINNGYTFFAPNSFTPDADGLNDIFLPKGTNWAPGSFQLLIFDRWGNMIFQTSDSSQGWNGKIKNDSKIVEMDVYVWKVHVSDTSANPHYYIGSVNIIR